MAIISKDEDDEDLALEVAYGISLKRRKCVRAKHAAARRRKAEVSSSICSRRTILNEENECDVERWVLGHHTVDI